MNNDELIHYGILGMKWGKRKVRYDDATDGKSRPIVSPKNIIPNKKKEIDEYTKSKREAAAKKYDTKKQELQNVKDDLTKNGVNSKAFKKMYGERASNLNDLTFTMLYGISKKQAVADGIRSMDTRIAYNERAAKAKREGKLTDGQKVAIGAAVVATAVVAGYALKKYNVQASAGKNITGSEFMSRFMKSHQVPSSNAYKGALDDNDIVIPKGMIFKRISADPEHNIRQNVYAAFTKDDVERYKGILPTYFGWIPKDNAYQIELEAKTTIVSPSLKKRVDAFTDLISENNNYREKYNIPSSASPKDLQDYGKKFYQQFATEEAGKTEIGKEYFNKLSKMGYNAWVDDNDRGRLSDTPMVIFNKDNELSRVGAKLLDPKEIQEASEIIKELGKRIL